MDIQKKMIPKKIHYCWFGPKPYPKLVLKCLATWKKHMPDYEICLWNEENSPMDHPFVKSAYEAKKYAFMADYVRFWALYNYGGIYMDTDVLVIKPFDDLLTYNCFTAWEGQENNIIGCETIGCIKHDKTMNRILKSYDEMFFQVDNINALVVTRHVSKLLGIEKSEDYVVFPYDYFYPLPFTERDQAKHLDRYITRHTYAIHLWNFSWETRSAKIKKYCVRKIKKILKVVLKK